MAKDSRRSADPRLRPFRVLMYAVYLVVVVSFSLLVIVSVVRSVLSMTPAHRPESDVTWSTTECADKAAALFEQMDARRRDFTAHAPVRSVDQEWTDFRLAWLNQVRDAESHCAIEGHSREELAEVFRRLESLMNLYTTHAVQFAGEIGGSVDKFHQAVAAARK